MRRPVRIALRVALVVLLLVVAVALCVVVLLRASLPPLDGARTVAGVVEPVTIERDAHGVPTLRANRRTDLAFATGFVHGQDRFFQMDLTRRAAAGELSELLGPLALDYDAKVRVHRFRWRAQRALAHGDPGHAALLAAYAQGVNAGRRSLRARPYEYFALRTAPVDWHAEDSYLVLYAMYLDLQDGTGARESTRGVLEETLGEEVAAFLWPAGTEPWDAPLTGDILVAPPVPGPDALDLRAATPAAPAPAAPVTPERGSNNWAVAGALTGHGRAILANDIHLGLGVPNIWYRVVLTWTADGKDERAVGITLPGAPALVVGSNGHVAWGFTNSYGDYADLVVLETDPQHPDRYRTPSGWKTFERHPEILRAKGAAVDTVEVLETIWGPVVDHDTRGRPRALRWVAHDVEGANLNLLRMEQVTDLEGALRVANLCGVPEQNFVAVDRDGRIGWTVLGRIPRRVDVEGTVPTAWADSLRGWDGYLEPSEVPRIVDPPEGRLWTANARVVSGEALAKLGDGGYALGARARQIRDDLRALDQPTERDLLQVQLDDRALFLARWQQLLLSTLDDDASQAALREVVRDWGGRAAVESAGYRFVRAFRLRVHEILLDALTRRCAAADSTFSTRWLPRSEGPVWRLVTERPAHLLPASYASWEDLLRTAAADAVQNVTQGGPAEIASHTWGERNRTRIQHPLSRAVPALGRWLDMTPRSLPGDSYMPRVQHPASGASERMVVSPGWEEEGIFHMPCGQSGHFLSPFYRDGHAAWEEGQPTPLLPGPAEHILVLRPR